MPTLRSQLDALAANFAKELIAALQQSSLHEITGSAKGAVDKGRKARPVARRAGGGQLTLPLAAPAIPASRATKARSASRLPRRSADEIQGLLDQVVELVKSHKDGFRAEEIRSQLGLQAKEMPRILKTGVASKVLKTKGQKRATTYFAR